jgi:hypothetical protein
MIDIAARWAFRSALVGLLLGGAACGGKVAFDGPPGAGGATTGTGSGGGPSITIGCRSRPACMIARQT